MLPCTAQVPIATGLPLEFHSEATIFEDVMMCCGRWSAANCSGRTRDGAESGDPGRAGRRGEGRGRYLGGAAVQWLAGIIPLTEVWGGGVGDSCEGDPEDMSN